MSRAHPYHSQPCIADCRRGEEIGEKQKPVVVQHIESFVAAVRILD